MATLSTQLILDSCPHCGRAKPTLELKEKAIQTARHDGTYLRWWGIYMCTTCGGIVTAGGFNAGTRPEYTDILEIYPSIPTISDSIPEKPREYLRQAQNSLHVPAGAIMLSASAVDAMLKEKGYVDGSLHDRIDKAAKDHLITDEMAKWAHQIRLDANEQRHPGKDVGLPTNEDGKLTFNFAMAFADYLFVLPSKVTRGIADSTAS